MTIEHPNIFKLLDLSTGHLPETVARDLNESEGVTAYDLGGYGWLLYVPEDIDGQVEEYASDDPDQVADEDKIHEAIVTIWRHARKHGCQYVLLDLDAPTDPDLPAYDW